MRFSKLIAKMEDAAIAALPAARNAASRGLTNLANKLETTSCPDTPTQTGTKPTDAHSTPSDSTVTL